jgi:RNA polymerase sigma-70 factor (ECF subfamily)
MSHSERAVVERARHGDLDALNRVVSLHEQTVARFVTSRVRSAADVEDVCQAVLCRACLKLGTFRGGSSVRTWMLSIARRAVADFHRGDRSSLFLSLEALDGELDQSPYSVGAPGERVHRLCDACWRIERCVACLMRTLPVEAQLAVILCDIYGFTDQEASRLLNRKLGSLRRLLRTTRATLDSVSGGNCALVRKTGLEAERCAVLAAEQGTCRLPAVSRRRKVAAGHRARRAREERLTSLRDELVRELRALARF